MALGPNTVNTFTDSLDDIRAAARDFREYANKMGQLVDTTRLENNTGLSWKEVVLQKLQAQGIDDLTDLEQNPQEILDSLFTVTPTMVGMSVFMSDRVKIRINAKVAAKIGVLTENAMARKVDVDLIAVAQAATTDVGTAGNPHSSDIVSTAVARIQSNTTEPWDGPIVHVAKGFQIKDIQDEGVAGWGTYPTVSGGITESFLRNGYSGPLFGADVHKDDNISVDSADDAISVTFASGPNSAIVMVTGAESRRVTDRKEGIGGGAEIMYATDEYGTGIRQQAWLMAGTSDASTPTV
jgi:hypothetical protein